MRLPQTGLFGCGRVDRQRRRIQPQPAQAVGEDRARRLAIVAAVGQFEAVVVAGEGKRGCHVGIAERPTPEQVVEIVTAVLEIHLDRLRLVLRLPHEHRIGVAAADVGKTADVAHHAAELVGPLPGGRECADPARRLATDRPVPRVRGDLEPVECHRQEFLDEKSHVAVSERVVLERPVAAILCTRPRGGNRAGRHEHRDRDGHFALRDQLVEHEGHAIRPVGLGVGRAILKHHQPGRLGPGIFRRHVHRPLPPRAREDRARLEDALEEPSPRALCLGTVHHSPRPCHSEEHDRDQHDTRRHRLSSLVAPSRQHAMALDSPGMLLLRISTAYWP